MRRFSLTVFLLAVTTGCTQPQLTQPVSPEGTAPVDRAEMRPVLLQEKNGTAVGFDVRESSLGYVRDRRALIGMSDRDDVDVLSVKHGAEGLNHVRLQQTLDGVKVWGGDVVVHSSNTAFKSLAGNLVVGLKDFDTMPVVDASTAMFAAKGDYATASKGAEEPLVFERETSELVVFPTGTHGARLAWHVVFFTELQNSIDPGLWNYFIDAKSGAILSTFNGIHTLSQASGPGGNAKVARTWNAALDVEASGTQFKMETTKFQTVNMGNSQSGTGTVVTGSLAAIGDAAINDAHGFAEQTLGMMQDWMGYNSIDGAGFRIRSRVHYGSSYENAFWDGTQMTYGDGASTFYPLSGDLDVVAHEINHGFTSNHSNLTYSGMSGGINEAFSDIAGTTAEFYGEGAGADWDLGTDIFKSTTGALRYMCTPSQDGASIDNAAQYTSGLDVHYSSGVFNRAFCRISRRLASGSPTGAATAASVRRAGKVFYEANDNYWTASTTFTQGCQGVYDAATALAYTAAELTAIRDSFADAGVFCGGATQPPPGCDETLTAASGTITSANYPANYGNNFSKTWCIQPATAATLTFGAFSTESGFDFVTIKNANGVEVSKSSGTAKPPVATSTKLFVTFTSDASVVSTGWTASWTSGTTTNQAPTTSLTSPANGATVSGTVTVSADAADADGSVAKVTFGLPDGTSVDDLSAPYSITWNTAVVADGSRTITARATDNVGATSALASRTVNVVNGSACVNGNFSATGLPLSIPDNNTTGITSTLAVTGAGNIGALTVSVNVTHPYKGDVKVTLVGPDGTQSILHNKTGGSADNIVLASVANTAFNGKVAAGSWRLIVADLAASDAGTLGSWSLNVTGNCGTTPPPIAWSGSASPSLPTVDNGQACTTLSVAGTGNAADVKLDVAGTHAYRSVLRGTLAHNGTTVASFPTGTFATGSGAFAFTARAVPGITGSATGSWTLCIVDTDAYGDTGVLSSWSVHN